MAFWLVEDTADDKPLVDVLKKLNIPFRVYKKEPTDPVIKKTPIVWRGTVKNLRIAELLRWDSSTTRVVWHGQEEERPIDKLVFTPHRFSVKKYIEHYKTNYLNHDAEMFQTYSSKNGIAHRQRVLDWMDSQPKEIQHFFVRPVCDYKPFTGKPMSRRDIGKLLGRFNGMIAIASCKKIQAEWRYVVVDGSIVASSRAPLKNNQPVKPPTLADEFAKEMVMTYQPDGVFIMDVCQLKSSEEFKVVECNYSQHSVENVGDLFKVMFSDSKLAAEFRMSHTKYSLTLA